MQQTLRYNYKHVTFHPIKLSVPLHTEEIFKCLIALQEAAFQSKGNRNHFNLMWAEIKNIYHVHLKIYFLEVLISSISKY